MLELKPLSPEAIPNALAKAERYRLLNEPGQAESICEDILQVQPDNQPALVMLLLALTDQFTQGLTGARANEILQRLENEYEKQYYAGIIWERKGRASLSGGSPGSGTNAYDCFQQAMTCYEKAEALRAPGNDDALLRWNTCARFLMRNPHLEPQPADRMEVLLLE